MQKAPSKPAVTLVSGPPGAGKTHYIRQRRQPGDLVVEWDALYEALGCLRPDQRPGVLSRFVSAARNAVFHKLRKNPEDDLRAAWISSCAPEAEKRQSYQERFDARVVVLETPASLCLARYRQDPGRSPLSEPEYRELVVSWWEKYQRRDGEEVVTP